MKLQDRAVVAAVILALLTYAIAALGEASAETNAGCHELAVGIATDYGPIVLDDYRLHVVGCDNDGEGWFPLEGRCPMVARNMARFTDGDLALTQALTELAGCVINEDGAWD